ncbi:MAG TPA: SDR family oxidoreductase [Ardenticatenaceae bacterium]|nr:SDR family oxidoreductase [Ardenticatenaceae bacterium]
MSTNEGRVAVVTGSTKRLGLAIARRLAHEGYLLVLNYREDTAAAAAAIAELRPRHPELVAIQADVSTPAGIERLIRESQHVLGGIDLWVNNVGPFVPKPLAETSDEEWCGMVDGNLASVFYSMNRVVPLMRAQGGGVIINIGSLNAEVPRGAPNTAAYNALKTAVVVLTRSVARSEGQYGIRANVVNPGMVDTAGVDPERIVAQTPLRRLIQPDEVAAAVAWLASDEARAISGEVINVSGGLWV